MVTLTRDVIARITEQLVLFKDACFQDVLKRMKKYFPHNTYENKKHV